MKIEIYSGEFGQLAAPGRASAKVRRMTKRQRKKWAARKLRSLIGDIYASCRMSR